MEDEYTEYESFSSLFDSICKIKEKIVKLSIKELYQFKKDFFKLQYPEWRLQLIWEYFWDDKTYEEIYHIFSSKNLI